MLAAKDRVDATSVRWAPGGPPVQGKPKRRPKEWPEPRERGDHTGSSGAFVLTALGLVLCCGVVVDTEWLGSEARRRVRDVVRGIEAKTSAELVVTVRARAAAYREVDMAFGALFALAALGVYVFAPVTFYDDLAAVAVVLAFAAGALMSSAIAPLKRLLVSRSRRRDSVRSAACVAFIDQRIATTSARSGVLVFASLFEREVEVLADTGVAVADMGAAWTEAVARLEAALRRGAALDDFTRALSRLGEALARDMPRAADDENELPDDLQR